MINNRLNEGVGKKIVEALKKQNDIEIIPVSENTPEITETPVDNSLEQEAFDIGFDEENAIVEEPVYEQPAYEPQYSNDIKPQAKIDYTTPAFEEQHATFVKPQINIPPAPAVHSTQNFAKALDDFEVPTNVAVLKQLISQLPSGVTKSTGAQIIRQTMEALGISMKSVLQEAQQVQESINASSRDCQANIMEYKRQIVLLENQVQKYTRQSAALNDIISLFIQTGN